MIIVILPASERRVYSQYDGITGPSPVWSYGAVWGNVSMRTRARPLCVEYAIWCKTHADGMPLTLDLGIIYL